MRKDREEIKSPNRLESGTHLEGKAKRARYGYYFLKPQLMILAFFIGVGIGAVLIGKSYHIGTWIWAGLGVICYGCVSTFLWFLARFVIPGNRIDLARRVLKDLNFPKEASVLDVGTGLGLYAIEAAKLLTEGKVVAIDAWEPEKIQRVTHLHRFSRPSGHSIGKARTNARLENVYEKIEFLNMDASHIEFPPDYFDVITCAYVLGHLGIHARTVLLEMRRVLRPDGKVAIVDNIRDFTYFLLSTPHLFVSSYLRGAKARRLTRRYWESIVQQAGFRITKLKIRRGIIWMRLARC